MKSLLVLLLLACCAGCAQHPRASARAPLTERQRDSVISKSVLPGAGVVGRAMAVSDAEERRAGRMDAMVDSLPH